MTRFSWRRPHDEGLTRQSALVLAVTWALVLGVAASAWAAAGHVVLLVIDGPRQTEFLAEPGYPHAPVLSGVLAPAGGWATSFANMGKTETLPGHSTLITGTTQLIANDGTQRPTRPTLFELLRKEQGLPQSSVWMIGGKDKFSALTYSTYPGFGAAYGASLNVALRSDPATFAEATSVLSADHPVFMCLNFASVDLAAHAGSWSAYLSALSRADSLAGALWDFIQADPVLAGDTDLIVTADHGRHDDAHGGFTSHGDGCPGCRTLFLIARGPDFLSGVVSARPRRQEDVGATIAHLLGVSRATMTGYVMAELLVDPSQLAVGDRGPAKAEGLIAWPSPFLGSVAVESMDGWKADRMWVLNAQGRVVRTEEVAGRPWRWDGRDAAGFDVGPGIYWIRAKDHRGDARTVRVVRAR
jgi:hypothetical protein